MRSLFHISSSHQMFILHTGLYILPKLVHSLAYKEHSTFSYTSKDSNIADSYKHAIVPNYLHRSHTRCTELEDIHHALYVMSTILKHGDQDPKVVLAKTKKYFNKTKKSDHQSETSKIASLGFPADRKKALASFLKTLLS